MPIIQYIGHKEAKPDNVAGTGLVWEGNGDCHLVSDKVAAKLLKHPDVWAEVEEPKTAAPGLQSAAKVQPVAPSEPVKQEPPAHVPQVDPKPGPEAKSDAGADKPDGGEGKGESQGEGEGKDIKPPAPSYDELSTETLKALAKKRNLAIGNSGRERVITLLKAQDAEAVQGAKE